MTECSARALQIDDAMQLFALNASMKYRPGIKLYYYPGRISSRNTTRTEGVATKIRVARCFAEESADTPAVLEIEVDQGAVPSADEILTFASIHGDFVCISDRIFRQFEILLPPESRLEILKDALLEVVRLEPEGSEGLNPYEVEDFVDALERTRQKVLGEDERP
ncbi:MAG: hypothetical protein PWR21_599 [Methanoculleus sp.]|nr:hypothetical protein [Methanoculleus sp.]